MRFGEENDPDKWERIMEGVAHNSTDLDETQGDDLLNDANPGVDETLRGFGSASLIKCLGRMEAQPNTTAPESNGSSIPSDRPATSYEPNLSQTLPQDSAQVCNPPQVDTHVQPVDYQHKKEETLETKPEQEQYHVKEEPESPRLIGRRRDSSVESTLAIASGAVRRPST